MHSIKLSELNAQPKYQAFIQRFMQAAGIECEPEEAEIDVIVKDGNLLIYCDASGDIRITSAGKELAQLADYTSSFDDSAEDEEEKLRSFTELHNALIEVHLNGFANFKTDEEGYVMTLCKFKD